MRLLALAALLPLAALQSVAWPGAARADVDPLTPEQTASFEKALLILTNGIVAASPSEKAGYTLTPAGDHYTLSVPLPNGFAAKGASFEGAYTAQVHMLDGGRWEFDDLMGPYPFTMNGPPDKQGKRVSTAAIAQGQTGRAVIDPTFATVSTLDQSIDSLQLTNTAPSLGINAHTGKATVHGVWTPIPGSQTSGRVDVAGTVTMDDLVESMSAQGKDMVTLSVQSAEFAGSAPNFSPAQAGLLSHAAMQMPPAPPPDTAPPKTDNGVVNPDAQAAQKMPKISPEQRQALRRIVDAMATVADGMNVSIKLTGAGFQAANDKVTLRSIELGERIGAKDGKTDLRLRVAMEGLSSPSIPDEVRPFIPQRVVLAPHLSGVPSHLLMQALDQLLDDGKPDPQQMDAMQKELFAHGPIALALDEAEVALGQAKLRASGAMQATALDPTAITGSADVQLTGYDALMQQIGTDPDMKKAAPVMIFLKGIGQQQGDAILWKITYAGQKVLVNGTDLSTMMPH